MKGKKYITLIIICLFTWAVPIGAHARGKIKVLLLSGSNNHNWKKTTPAIRDILLESDLFEVEITEKPDLINAGLLSQYQLILSNWNDFPNQKCTWSVETKTAITDFVEEGGGIVFIHSASSAHTDWKKYQEISGASWGTNTRHGKVAPFEVKLKDVNHPITKGMSDFWISDELWVEMNNYNTCNVLGEAYASESNNGSGEMEPVMFEGKFGKGRSFNLILGHDEQVMKNIGFQTLLLRGAEWSATGKVKQKVPKGL